MPASYPQNQGELESANQNQNQNQQNQNQQQGFSHAEEPVLLELQIGNYAKQTVKHAGWGRLVISAGDDNSSPVTAQSSPDPHTPASTTTISVEDADDAHALASVTPSFALEAVELSDGTRQRIITFPDTMSPAEPVWFHPVSSTTHRLIPPCGDALDRAIGAGVLVIGKPGFRVLLNRVQPSQPDSVPSNAQLSAQQPTSPVQAPSRRSRRIDSRAADRSNAGTPTAKRTTSRRSAAVKAVAAIASHARASLNDDDDDDDDEDHSTVTRHRDNHRRARRVSSSVAAAAADSFSNAERCRRVGCKDEGYCQVPTEVAVPNDKSGGRVCQNCYVWLRRHFQIDRNKRHTRCDPKRDVCEQRCRDKLRQFARGGIRFLYGNVSVGGSSPAPAAPTVTIPATTPASATATAPASESKNQQQQQQQPVRSSRSKRQRSGAAVSNAGSSSPSNAASPTAASAKKKGQAPQSQAQAQGRAAMAATTKLLARCDKASRKQKQAAKTAKTAKTAKKQKLASPSNGASAPASPVPLPLVPASAVPDAAHYMRPEQPALTLPESAACPELDLRLGPNVMSSMATLDAITAGAASTAPAAQQALPCAVDNVHPSLDLGFDMDVDMCNSSGSTGLDAWLEDVAHLDDADLADLRDVLASPGLMDDTSYDADIAAAAALDLDVETQNLDIDWIHGSTSSASTGTAPVLTTAAAPTTLAGAGAGATVDAASQYHHQQQQQKSAFCDAGMQHLGFGADSPVDLFAPITPPAAMDHGTAMTSAASTFC